MVGRALIDRSLGLAVLVTMAGMAARPAEACGGCIDLVGSIQMPFLPWLAILAVLWAVAVRASGGVLQVSGWWLAILLTVAVGLSLATMGSVLAGAAVLLPAWLVALPVVLVRDLRRWRRGAGCVAPAAVSAATLAVAAVLVAVGSARARSDAWLIGHLGHAGATPAGVVVPPLLARGEAAVEPLLARARRDLAAEDDLERGTALASAVYILGEVGGEAAAAFLTEVVTAIDPSAVLEEWQVLACFTLARVAPDRAVTVLGELLAAMPPVGWRGDPCTGERLGGQRWVAAAAAAVTATDDGVALALDHLDDLLHRSEGHGWVVDAETARVVADVLVSCHRPACLRGVRYIPHHLRRVEERRRRGEAVGEPSGGCALDHEAAEIAALWATDEAAIRRRWADLLAAAGG